jgi:hypothetical protein
MVTLTAGGIALALHNRFTSFVVNFNRSNCLNDSQLLPRSIVNGSISLNDSEYT